jgi:hypothetical protein
MLFRCAFVKQISQVLHQISFCDRSGNHNVPGRATLAIDSDVASSRVFMFSLLYKWLPRLEPNDSL